MVYDERRYQIVDKNLNENHKKINKIEENAKKNVPHSYVRYTTNIGITC